MKSPQEEVHISPHATAAHNRPLWPAYGAEAVCSMGTTLMTVAIFFWTQTYFGWDLKRNFLLAAMQGIAYTAGALLAQRVATTFGRRRALIGIYLLLTALALLTTLARSPAVMLPILFLYSMIAASNWPMLESLVTGGADATTISRRVALYNLMWSITNALTTAVSGTIIMSSRQGLFLAAAAVHLVCAVLLFIGKRIDPGEQPTQHPHAAPEPELLRSRTLAMWLARIALPATYVVIFSMMAMMPSLPVMHRLTVAHSTRVSSVWMIARTLTFLLLGFTAWWHTRPRLLLFSTIVMLIAFWGVTIAPSSLNQSSPSSPSPGTPGEGRVRAFPQQPTISTSPADPPPLPYRAPAQRDGSRGEGLTSSSAISPSQSPPTSPHPLDLPAMILSQIILGAALGTIYAGSLYFGMVLSEGSTEHGGYHEALIGLGCILGPGAGALVQSLSQTQTAATPWPAISAVSLVISITIAAAGVATFRIQRHHNHAA
ncbi:MAG TPA: MFS transporter [Tepidisphaeraceae bacterium]